MTIFIVNYDNKSYEIEWCKMTEVKGTPAIFINGRKLPKNYKIEDIRYFI